jgi:hypothetical protein
LLHGTVADDEAVVSVSVDQLQADETAIRIDIPAKAMHFFDATTGRRL